MLKTHWTWLAVLVGIPLKALQMLYRLRRVPEVLICGGGLLRSWRVVKADVDG